MYTVAWCRSFDEEGRRACGVAVNAPAHELGDPGSNPGTSNTFQHGLLPHDIWWTCHRDMVNAPLLPQGPEPAKSRGRPELEPARRLGQSLS